jgi:hypothetical protein
MIELALAFYLVFILPGRHIWRSIRPGRQAQRPVAERYLSSMRDIGVTLLVLLAICWWNGYSAADMGLSAPVAGAPLWCLIAAAVAMSALLAGSVIQVARMTPEKRAAMLKRQRRRHARQRRRTAAILPARRDARRRLGAAVSRLPSLLVLTPSIGAWGAVAVSGLSYGAAHGYKNPKQFSLACNSALAFASATC